MKKILKKIIQLYLKVLSKIALRRYKPEIIAIAGSTGKNPIKEEINDVLKNNFSVRKGPKKYNAELGVPLTIFGLIANTSKIDIWLKIILKATQITLFTKHFPQKIILELGVSHPNDMDYFLSIIKPKVTILTNINTQYLDNFGSLDKIAEEYKKLVKATSKNGLVLLNSDDLRIKNLNKFSDATVWYYGQNEGSDFNVQDIKLENNKQIFNIKHKGEQKKYEIEKFGLHHINAKAIKEALKKYYD